MAAGVSNYNRPRVCALQGQSWNHDNVDQTFELSMNFSALVRGVMVKWLEHLLWVLEDLAQMIAHFLGICRVVGKNWESKIWGYKNVWCQLLPGVIRGHNKHCLGQPNLQGHDLQIKVLCPNNEDLDKWHTQNDHGHISLKVPNVENLTNQTSTT